MTLRPSALILMLFCIFAVVNAQTPTPPSQTQTSPASGTATNELKVVAKDAIENIDRLEILNLITDRELQASHAREAQQQAELAARNYQDATKRFEELRQQISSKWVEMCKKYGCDPQKTSFDPKTGKIVANDAAK